MHNKLFSHILPFLIPYFLIWNYVLVSFIRFIVIACHLHFLVFETRNGKFKQKYWMPRNRSLAFIV